LPSVKTGSSANNYFSFAAFRIFKKLICCTRKGTLFFMSVNKNDVTSLTFESLPYNSKTQLLYNEGIYIGKRALNGFTAVLYQVHSFYVEIFFMEYRRQVKCFHVSESTHILNPYLDQIEVNELILV